MCNAASVKVDEGPWTPSVTSITIHKDVGGLFAPAPTGQRTLADEKGVTVQVIARRKMEKKG